MAMCMAGCLASCAASALCRACTCVSCYASEAACGCCCAVLGWTTTDIGVLMGRFARMTYLTMLILTAVTAGVFRNTAPQVLNAQDIIAVNLSCPPDDTSMNCMARAFVMRMTFAHSLFHLVLAILCFMADSYENPRVHFHVSFWPVKIVFWVGLHVASLFMPTRFFLAFKWFALVCAVIFLIIQIIMFVEVVLDFNAWFIKEDGVDNYTGKYHVLIMVISFMGFATAVGLTAVNIFYFGERTDMQEGGCQLYLFFSSFNICVWFLLLLFSFRATTWMPDTGLLPATSVAAFMTFKVLMALYGQKECNKIAAQQTSTAYDGPPAVIGGVSIAIAILLAAYNSFYVSGSLKATAIKGDGSEAVAGSSFGQGLHAEMVYFAGDVSVVTVSGESFGPGPAGGDPWVYRPPAPVVVGSLGREGSGVIVPPSPAATRPPIREDSGPAFTNVMGGGGQSQQHQPRYDAPAGEATGGLGYGASMFHFSFMIGMCFVAMQMTNWNEDFSVRQVDSGSFSMWIKIVDSWLLGLIYLWAMCAPLIFKGREFS